MSQPQAGSGYPLAAFRLARVLVFVLVLVLVLGSPPQPRAADWLQFRGPHGSGASAETGLHWDLGAPDTLAWKRSLPGRGLSSPVIIGDRVFVTSASGPRQEQLHVLCLGAADGTLRWERQFWATGRTMCHEKTCVAAPSPASDGERLFALFSSNDLLCLDLDGNLIWLRGLTLDYPNVSNSLGMSSSLVAADGVVVAQVENDSESYALGLDARTGTNVWRLDRPRQANWTSPVLLPPDTAPRLVALQSSKGVTGVEVKTGRVAWTYADGASTIPSSAAAGEALFVPSFGLTAIEVAPSGGQPKQLWRSGPLRPGTPSPVVVGGRVYVLNDAGVLSCGDARDGRRLWQLRLKGPISATPVVAENRMLVVSEKGVAQVVDVTKDEGEVIAERDLGEPVLGTPAIAHGAIYVRSDHALYRFAALSQSTQTVLPNFVIIFADDLGYADLGCYGAKNMQTPNLDRMAAEGLRFTSFYAAQAVCSASRAALLTGCYPNRIGILGALGPKSTTGIHDQELTIAEVLKPRGYATAIYGKWHLGDAPQFLPTRHGFDEYFGLPYSNDMWPFHPDYVDLPPEAARRKRGYPDLPLIENDRVFISPVTGEHQAQLTTWYTEHAIRFIERHRRQPFFLYVPHAMPHVPLFVSEKFKGKSKAGLYGDVIMEIDWSVGEILAALRQHGLDERTLVIFTSDNGPWLLYGDHAGSARPFREGKGTMFEGGVRVPCIARWPGRIPAGTVSTELAATIDILPTLARLAGTERPSDQPIDGRDIWPLLSGQPGAKTPHDAYLFYWGGELQAVRSGNWKLHFSHAYPKPQPAGGDGRPGKYAQLEIGRALYDLETDIGETTDVAAKHPEVVARIEALAERAREDLGDSSTKRQGKGVRQPGRLPQPATAP